MAEKPTPRDDSRDDQDSIRAISVRGFKCFAAESRIEIRPLTILAGANSSGKSSIMQPLLLMKQTLEATYDPGALLLSGPNVKQTTFEARFAPAERSRLPHLQRLDRCDGRHDPQDHVCG